MELNFDRIYSLTVLAMKLNRSHPSIKRDKKWFMQFCLMHGLFTILFGIIVNCIIKHDLKNNDFSSTCTNGILCVLYFVVTFNYSTMLINQELLSSLIETMKEDYLKISNSSIGDQTIMSEYTKKSLRVCRQWLVISVLGFAIFLIKNFFLYAYNYYKGDFRLLPIYELTYPKILEDNRENIVVYLVMYVLMMYYGMYSALMYIAFVPLGPVFMLHSCAQLELIKNRVEGLFIAQNEKEVTEKLKDIVRQLQYVYSFVEKTKVCFRVVYELTLKATTIILPITCYEVIEAFHRGEIPLEFLVFIVGGVLISSSPCYYSDLLMEKGEEVRLAIYCSGWETMASRSARSTLLVILLRALEPIAIRTMFRTVCLDALTDLFQQSYAIFNLMNAMWK